MTVHLLTSRNFLQELQTSIHIILAHQHHNSLVLSTRDLKCKKESFFACWFQSLERDAQWIQKFVKEILQKRSKKSSSQYSRNWRFLYGAWWDNAKFKHSKIESNWSSSTIFFVHLKTLGLFLLYNEHLPFYFFYFFAYLFVLLCYISSFPFYFQCN